MNQQTLTVKGTGRESLKPDQILITCTLSVKDTDYAALTSLEAEKLEELTKALEGVGFDKSEIKTSSFNIGTEYENYQTEEQVWKRRFLGYSLDHGLSLAFDCDMKLLNKVVNALSSCEKADPSFNIGFTVKDKESASDRLLQKAVKDARRKAAAIAEAAGVSLGEIQNICFDNEEAAFASPTVFGRAAGGAEPYRCAAKFDITPDDIVSEMSVTVVWGIESGKKTQ